MTLSLDDLARLDADAAAAITLARQVAQRRMTTLCAVFRAPAASGGKTGAVVSHATNVPCHIYAPSGQSAMGLLADLGGPRATQFGELAYDAGVRDADELHVGSAVYHVERAVVRRNLTLCALSEEVGSG